MADTEVFTVTVWNMINGDVEKKIWEASQLEVDEVLELYIDEPFYDVVVEDRTDHYTTF